MIPNQIIINLTMYTDKSHSCYTDYIDNNIGYLINCLTKAERSYFILQGSII